MPCARPSLPQSPLAATARWYGALGPLSSCAFLPYPSLITHLSLQCVYHSFVCSFAPIAFFDVLSCRTLVSPALALCHLLLLSLPLGLVLSAAVPGCSSCRASRGRQWDDARRATLLLRALLTTARLSGSRADSRRHTSAGQGAQGAHARGARLHAPSTLFNPAKQSHSIRTVHAPHTRSHSCLPLLACTLALLLLSPLSQAAPRDPPQVCDSSIPLPASLCLLPSASTPTGRQQQKAWRSSGSSVGERERRVVG
ncbi:unnamed protein product [Closterium sp. Naga37s-1]|nr:unnamed protein product [Closterium sp. Naga37s-1]